MTEENINNQTVVDTEAEDNQAVVISEEHLAEDYNKLMAKIEKDISEKTEEHSISPANVGNNLKAVLQFIYKGILTSGGNLSIPELNIDGIDLSRYVKREDLQSAVEILENAVKELQKAIETSEENTEKNLSDILTDYTKTEDLNKAIENFVTDTNIKEILSDYAKSTDFADYTKTEDLKENYATKNELYDFVPRETSGWKEADKGRITGGYLYLRLYDQESKEDLKITPSMLMEYLTPKATKTAGLEGKRDGKNNVFTTQNSFVLGTSTIWFNGVRLFNEKSYVETDDRTISFKSYIPKETDEILIEAIFKDE